MNPDDPLGPAPDDLAPDVREAWEEIRDRSLVTLIQRDSITVLVAAQALAQVRAGNAEIAGELRNLLADLYVPVPLEAVPDGPPN